MRDGDLIFSPSNNINLQSTTLTLGSGGGFTLSNINSNTDPYQLNLTGSPKLALLDTAAQGAAQTYTVVTAGKKPTTPL